MIRKNPSFGRFVESVFQNFLKYIYRYFLFSISKFTHNYIQKNKIKIFKKMRTPQKHDLVTPYIAMEITRGNNILMTSPTSGHLILKHL